jgi:hypothetical protein
VEDAEAEEAEEVEEVEEAAEEASLSLKEADDDADDCADVREGSRTLIARRTCLPNIIVWRKRASFCLQDAG